MAALGQIEMFGPNLTKLAQTRQVIGRRSAGPRPHAAGRSRAQHGRHGQRHGTGVLKKLGYDKVDVLGYSIGGGVAFPVRRSTSGNGSRLALVSTPYSQDGFYPEMTGPQQGGNSDAADGGADEQTTIVTSRTWRSRPHPEEFPKLLDQMGAYMRKHTTGRRTSRN